MANKKTPLTKEMDNTLDFATGLTLTQLKCAQLLAEGNNYTLVAKTVGVHHNTIRGWAKHKPNFRNVMATHKPRELKPIVVAQLDDMSVKAVDVRFVELLSPAIKTLHDIMIDKNNNPTARVTAAKFVATTIYARLTSDVFMEDEALTQLRDAMKDIKRA